MNSVDIYKRCEDKMQEGIEKYGEFDPETDKRDLVDETIEELVDAINYVKMHRTKVGESWDYLHAIETGFVESIIALEHLKTMEAL